MELTHYLRGDFVTEEKLLISPRDLGFTRGYAVFDFFRTYNGHRPFMFKYHIERLFNSANAISLLLPWTQDEVEDIILKTLDKNDTEKEFAVRVIVSGGTPGLSPTDNQPTLMVLVDDLMSFPKSLYENGIKVLTVDYKRYKPISKTVHYVEAIQHMAEVYAGGFDDMLYVHDSLVLEGAYTNFFCLINDTLVTAKNDVLPGITRRVIAEKLQLYTPVEMRDLRIGELSAATEAFMSVSGKGIVPVVKVDDLTIGDGMVGPITKDVMNKLAHFIVSNKW